MFPRASRWTIWDYGGNEASAAQGRAGSPGRAPALHKLKVDRPESPGEQASDTASRQQQINHQRLEMVDKRMYVSASQVYVGGRGVCDGIDLRIHLESWFSAE